MLVQVVSGEQRRTLHRSGMRLADALREVCLQIKGTVPRRRVASLEDSNQAGLALPEPIMLGAIGRLDLLAS